MANETDDSARPEPGWRVEFDSLDPMRVDRIRADETRVVDDTRQALLAALAEEDYEEAVAVIRVGWFHLFAAGGFRAALEEVPPARIREYPLLAMLLGIALNVAHHRRIRSLRYFVLAVNAANSPKRNVQAVDRALILASAAVAYRLMGRATTGVKTARAALAALDGLSEEQAASIHVLTRIYAHIGTTLYHAGLVDESLAVFERGLAEAPSSEPSLGFMNLAMFCGIQALQGEIHEAEAYLQLARSPEWDDQERSNYSGTFYRIAEATAAIERFDAATARAHIAAMDIDRRTIEHWIAIAITEARVELIEGRAGAGLAGLDAFAAMRGSEGRSQTARGRLAPMRALLQLALGHPDAADAIIRRDAAPGPASNVSRARVELALGRHGAALQLVRSVAGAPMPTRLLAESIALEAAALLRFSERVRSQSVIDLLGSVLDRTGQRLTLALVPDADYRRIITALSDAGYRDLVDDLPDHSFFPDPDEHTLLTERELAVLRGLMRTSSASIIASELIVSVNTVKTQLKSLYRKLGVSSRDQAIAVALDRHLLVDQDPR